MILYGTRPDPDENPTVAAERESEVVHNDRQEEYALRDAEDRGGYTKIGGRRYDDVPSWDEL